MRRILKTPDGTARILMPDPCLVSIQADTTEAAVYAQGYAAGWLRAWQLDLTRRVAAGRLSEAFGRRTLARDRLQRRLGLCALARRDMRHDAQTRQGRLVRSYVGGIQQAWRDRKVPAIEFALLALRPEPFTTLDAYRVAHLKYFINTTWRFELLFTLICSTVGPARARALFSIETDGDPSPPFMGPDPEQWAPAAESALRDAGEAMALLGLEAPDIGSNVVAVGANRSRSGHPLLAADPHMGQVVPAYTLLCHLQTRDGLDVRGAHFPGTPGIFAGRTPTHAWGMAGVMADNQDLFWGRLRGERADVQVQVAGQWCPLQTRIERIAARGADDTALSTLDLAPTSTGKGRTAAGRLLFRRGDTGLFLRWPALERGCGDIALEGLARARGWTGFRAALAGMRNTPVVAAYADAHDIGLQMGGDIPRRDAPTGAIVQSLDRAAHQWSGYVSAHAMPSRFGSPDSVLVHSNQHDAALLAGAPHIGMRWHPPSRARRLQSLLTGAIDADTLMRAQDDKIDTFARDTRPDLIARLPRTLAGEASRVLAHRDGRAWDGDTQQTAQAVFFERWFEAIGRRCAADLPPRWASAWLDEWPAWRWAVRRMMTDRMIAAAFVDALRAQTAPQVEYRHALRRHPLGRWLGQTAQFAGGSRETVHVARRSLDFLTAGQTPGATPTPYCFGPALKLVCDLAQGGATHIAAPLPASGRAMGRISRHTLQRWRRGERLIWTAPSVFEPQARLDADILPESLGARIRHQAGQVWQAARRTAEGRRRSAHDSSSSGSSSRP